MHLGVGTMTGGILYSRLCPQMKHRVMDLGQMMEAAEEHGISLH